MNLVTVLPDSLKTNADKMQTKSIFLLIARLRKAHQDLEVACSESVQKDMFGNSHYSQVDMQYAAYARRARALIIDLYEILSQR